ncbi:MAG: hypothetical protein IH593_12325, partial [Bacteroidales bacterium]|nr:hypothetical protein [Bacteroidales bacterium]
MSIKSNVTGVNEHVLRVAWAAHGGAGATTGAEAVILMRTMLPAEAFIMVDSQPDIILFMSGGSERRAIEMADPD